MTSSESPAEVRVVLLGRTGLDAALRLDPAIELVRVKSTLDAIGEVANPIDGGEADRTVVVVAPHVEGLVSGGKVDGSAAQEFVSALRVACPSVVVLAVQNGSPVPQAYDAAVRPEVDAEGLRAAMRWRPGPAPAPEAIVPVAPVRAGAMAAPAPRAEAEAVRAPERAVRAPEAKSAEARAGDPRDLGDMVLVGLLLKGQDPLPAALSIIRERVGDASVEFVGVTDGVTTGAYQAPVTWESACFGDLRAAKTPPAVLGGQARWLASWLRLRDQHAQLRAAAFTDALTGAWNRRYFDRFISTAIDEARAARTYLTVLVFDIDNFKTYNDQYGHEAGDEILRETVRLLRSTIRPTDRVCRVGGDEFAVIFHEPQGPRTPGSQHPTDVLAIASRFQQQVLNHKFPKLLDSAAGTLTISGGLATFPWDGSSPGELLTRADQLAMQSKKQGKNAITLGPGAMRLMDVR